MAFFLFRRKWDRLCGVKHCSIIDTGLTVSYFFSFAKYKTVRNRSLFRLASIVSRNWKKYENVCFELFRETAKQCFVSYFRIFSLQFCTFSSNFITFTRVRTFYSSFVLFKSSFVPFIVLFKLFTFFRVAYLFYHNVSFRIFVYFRYNFVHSLRIS